MIQLNHEIIIDIFAQHFWGDFFMSKNSEISFNPNMTNSCCKARCSNFILSKVMSRYKRYDSFLNVCKKWCAEYIYIFKWSVWFLSCHFPYTKENQLYTGLLIFLLNGHSFITFDFCSVLQLPFAFS